MTMFGDELAFLAGTVRAGKLRFDSADAKQAYPDEGAARKALHKLEHAGLIFPLARGRYAAPHPDAFVHALELPTASDRLAVWLPRWLDREAKEHDPDLARGLGWKRATFFGLAVLAWTNLDWRGPLLFVPIEDHTVGKLHHRVPILVGDPVFGNDMLQPSPLVPPVPVPSRMELARILSLQTDPRLVEAAHSLIEREPKDKREQFLRARNKSDVPLPFPESESQLPMGPPFRFRLYAPRSLVLENLRRPLKRPMNLGE